jgi:hypothetical protein
MPRNGSGSYSAPINSWNPAVNNVPATPTDWQAQLNDIVAALTQSVSKDGQTTMSGNLPMGSNKLTGLGVGSAVGDSAAWQQLFSQGVPTNIASAATMDIGIQNTTILNVTGTTTITSFGVNYNGPRFLRFDGVLTLTHNPVSLILPNGQNIVTAQNDCAIVVPVGSPANGWIVVAYKGANGSFADLSYTGTLTGGAGVINIGSGQIYKTAGGLVGIGTATPTYKVDVFDGSISQISASRTGGQRVVLGTDTSTGAYVGTIDNSSLNLLTNSTVKFTVDTAGNAALGKNPDAWDGSFKALQLNTACSVFGVNNGAYISSNSRFSGGADRYIINDFATQYEQTAGSHTWKTAAAGTAGTVITFISALNLSQTGDLSLSNTAPNVTVNGTAAATFGYTVASSGLNTSVFQYNAVDGSIKIGGIQSFSFPAFWAGNSEGARLTTSRYFKASNTGAYGGVAGLGDLSTNLSHNFQSDQNNTIVAALSGNTGSAVTSFDSLLATAATGKHFKASINGATVFSIESNGTAIGVTESPLTNNTRLASTAFVQNAVQNVGVGSGQTWQDLAASRAVATNYTNSTGRSIVVSISETTTAASSLTVGGVVVANNSGTNHDTTLTAVIPSGAVYRFDGGGFTHWAELR